METIKRKLEPKRKITEKDKARQKELHDKYRSMYRYDCEICKYRTYFNHIITKHVQSERHKLMKKINGKEYDYKMYMKAIKNEEEPDEEGMPVDCV